jgi:IS30 family transposase
MAKMCRRLSAVERVRIELGLRDGLSLTRIAEAIGRPKGTVSKEIARHGGGGAYAADAAHIQSVGVLRGGRPNRLKPGNSRPWRLCCASGGHRNKSQAGESAWKTTSRHPPGWR